MGESIGYAYGLLPPLWANDDSFATLSWLITNSRKTSDAMIDALIDSVVFR